MKIGNNRSNWKGFEREVAKDFGGTRTPLSGSNSKHTRADVIHEYLFIECKKRKEHSHHTLFKKVEKYANQESAKIPVVATKETGKHGYLIILRPEDLMRVAKLYEGESNGDSDL